MGSKNVQIAHVQHSTVTISIDGGPHRAVPLEPAWIELPSSVTSPARLLRARYGVVPYVPPGDLAERLGNWAQGPEPFAVRMVAGTAGAGKTRIAIELCRSLAELGWLTGLLKARLDPEQLDLLADTRTARLVVIDYAETRLEQLADVLPTLARQASGEHLVRVLLTIRSRTASIEDVRRVLYGRGEALDVVIDHAAVDLLSELPFGAAERVHLAAIAVEAISRRLGREAPPRAEPDLGERAPTTPLMVLIASYLAVVDGETPISRTELLDGLLRHEDQYWSATAPAQFRDEKAQVLRRRVVALATLAGPGSDESEAAAEKTGSSLLRLVPDLVDASEERRGALARWAHDLYPGSAWWNPVEPDLIGEHLVATTYGDQPEVLGGVLTNRPADALVQPLRMLARAARDHAPLASTLHGVVGERVADLCWTAIEQATRTDAPLLLQAGMTVASALEPLVSFVPPEPARLLDVINSFPQANTVLGHLAVTLTTQVADHTRGLAAADPDFEPALAAVLNDLGGRLSNLGRREQAVAVAQEAVGVFRRLTATNPAAYEPQLAIALHNLGMFLSLVGDREEALAVTKEAVEIRRSLAAANPAAFEPALANSLTNMGTNLSDLGRHWEGAQVIEDAIEISRRLAAANSTAFERFLAGSLNNLSVCLSYVGHTEQALAAIEEASEIYRSLAAANPAAFEPDLALALINLGTRSSNLARHERALAATQEAVEICRSLVAVNPAAFEAHLARALWAFAEVRAASRVELSEALMASDESVEVYSRLVEHLPGAFSDTMVGAVRTAADVLDALGHHAEAHEVRRSLDDTLGDRAKPPMGGGNA